MYGTYTPGIPEPLDQQSLLVSECAARTRGTSAKAANTAATQDRRSAQPATKVISAPVGFLGSIPSAAQETRRALVVLAPPSPCSLQVARSHVSAVATPGRPLNIPFSVFTRLSPTSLNG